MALLEVLHHRHHVSLEHSNDDAKTAMHEAAQSGRDECIDYLVSQGAKVDALKRADWWVWQWVWPHCLHPPFLPPQDTVDAGMYQGFSQHC